MRTLRLKKTEEEEWFAKIKEINLLEITGRLVKTIILNSKNFDFELLDIEEGIFIIQIMDEFNQTTNSKIIKI